MLIGLGGSIGAHILFGLLAVYVGRITTFEKVNILFYRSSGD